MHQNPEPIGSPRAWGQGISQNKKAVRISRGRRFPWLFILPSPTKPFVICLTFSPTRVTVEGVTGPVGLSSDFLPIWEEVKGDCHCFQACSVGHRLFCCAGLGVGIPGPVPIQVTVLALNFSLLPRGSNMHDRTVKGPSGQQIQISWLVFRVQTVSWKVLERENCIAFQIKGLTMFNSFLFNLCLFDLNTEKL